MTQKAEKTQTTHLRLSLSELAEIDAAWRGRGFKSRSSFMRAALRRCAGMAAESDDVLEAMRRASIELAAVGRLINQAVKVIHQMRKSGRQFDPREPFAIEDLERLNAEIRSLRTALKAHRDHATQRQGEGAAS